MERLSRFLALDRLAAAAGLNGVERLGAPEAYALWADTYPARPHNPLMQAEQAVMSPILQGAQPVCALDVGTGTGRYLEVLRAGGARTAIGIDLSMAMLSRRSVPAPVVCAHGCRLPFADRRFDTVCASLMVGDVDDLPGWVHEMARVIMPGGHLVYSDFHPAWHARRWRRTFQSVAGRRVELSYFPHTIDDHLGALAAAGFIVRAIREPRAAGRRDPVVAIFHAARPGRRAGPAL